MEEAKATATGGQLHSYGLWDGLFLGLILISTVVDFRCARYIAALKSPWRQIDGNAIRSRASSRLQQLNN